MSSHNKADVSTCTRAVGSIFDFQLKVQGLRADIPEYLTIQVAAIDFEQALENLQRAYPALEGVIDEMRLRHAVGEFRVPPVT